MAKLADKRQATLDKAQQLMKEARYLLVDLLDEIEMEFVPDLEEVKMVETAVDALYTIAALDGGHHEDRF
jgi:hypothetical protein